MFLPFPSRMLAAINGKWVPGQKDVILTRSRGKSTSSFQVTHAANTHISSALSSSTGGLQTERQTRWGWKAQTLKPYLHTACQSRAEPSCEMTECIPWVGGCMGILPKTPGSPWRKLPPALKGKCYPVSRDHGSDLWGQMANGWRGCIPLRVCLKDPGELPGRISIYRVWGISCILWFVPEHRIYYTDRFPVPRHW